MGISRLRLVHLHGFWVDCFFNVDLSTPIINIVDMKFTIVLLSALVFSCANVFSQSVQPSNSGSTEEPKTQVVKWYTFEEALALNAQQPRKIIMDVYTDWCGWCKVLDQQTFSHPYIAAYLNENFYPVKFNAEQLGDVVYMGTTFKNRASGKRSAHDLIIALTEGKLSYPTLIFFDEQSSPLTIVPGFHGAAQLEPILAFLVGNSYKTGQTFEDFMKTFVSKIPK